ncbi:DinB family protein [candidate division KSB1 bacterium]|nr:MAG: DinB family protein [candidate division KSB1 bacterium]MBC6947603.1 DinB family protein [candidate division KSB1 bacterium]MCE7943198.1 DinB family protein [Chlorobi bacterium CHB1]MDL1874327.1 DinB family protein [Cytophagia bacterium CHB2]
MKKNLMEAPQKHLSGFLDRSLQALEKQVLDIPVEKWDLKVNAESWSIEEIIHHLILVEVQRLQQLKDLLEGRRESAPARAEIQKPNFDQIRHRESPVKTREEMEPSPGIPAKVLLAGLRRARNETMDFVQAADLTQLEHVWLNTISLGPLNGVEFIEFLAAHMERHAKQIEDVRKSI